MLLFELVRYLEESGIGIEVVEGRLRITGDEALLTAPVVEAMKTHKSALLAHYGHGLPGAPTPQSREAALPLSFAQQRLYFLYQYDSSITHFILPVELELCGALDARRLAAAIEAAVDRHPIYRTTYAVEAGTICQRYRADMAFRVEQVDGSGAPDDAEAILADAWNRIAARPFDLANELPVRACLFKQAEDRHTLLISFHHIATDGWSNELFIKDLADAYRRLGDGEAPRAPAALSYPDYAVWQRQRFNSGALEVARSYWRHALEGARDVLELPLDHARPPVQSHNGGLCVQALPEGVARQVAAFAREHGVSEYTVYLGAYGVLLNRLTAENDIVVGTDVFGREQAGLQDMAGFFVNQLAQRCRVDEQAAVKDYLRQLHASTVMAFDYQDLPFDKVVEDLGIERDPAYPPVFQVKFLYERQRRVLDSFEGIALRQRERGEVRSQYDMTLKLAGDSAELHYNRDLFLADTAAGWLALYVDLLVACVGNPDAAVRDLLGAQLAQAMASLIHGDVATVVPSSLFDGLDRRIADAPDAVAVRSPQGVMTYAQFSRLSSRIAARLSRMGVSAGARVGVFLERSPELAASVVAVLRLGAVLVPLDTSYPSDHLLYTLDDSGVAVVVSSGTLLDHLPDYVGFTLDIDAIGDRDPVLAAYPSLEDDAPAYLLYTSGSTGQPKGTLISRRSFANLCDWYGRFAGLDHRSRVLLMIPIGFDASLKNIVAPLVAGGELVLARSDRFDPADLCAQIRDTGVTVINCVPSAAYALIRQASLDGFASLASLQLLALGGEALDKDQLVPWLASAACRSRVANIYGPTECADISVAFQADKSHWLAGGAVVIGRPIQNVRAYILDASSRLCPRGVTGELVIAGDGVGLGYHQRAELTAASFVDLSPLDGRAYRTGDYCRYGQDGQIVYLGRRDGQIKVRGKRVEVGEIVHQINRLLPSRRVSVQLHDQGNDLLLAFIDGGPAPLSVESIKAALLQQLPRHMVPAQFVFVDAMPLTANGKVCGKSLMALFDARLKDTPREEAAFGPVERKIAAVWEQLLRTPVRNRDDDFFSLGGDSILSIQAVAELKERGIDAAVADLFKYPTVGGLAQHLADAAPAAQAMEPVAPFALLSAADQARLPAGLEDAYPATPLQLGMVFHALVEDGGSTYHDVMSFDLRFDFDEPLFRQAIARVVALHPTLRTGFDLASFAVPMQLVHADAAPWIDVDDIASLDEEAQERYIARRIGELKATPFDLRGPSLIHFTLLRRGVARIQCIIDAHHAIMDGWSMATMQRQIMEYYGHLRFARPLADVFDTGRFRYADYVASVAGADAHGPSAAYWGEFCRALPVLAPIAPARRGTDGYRKFGHTLDAALGRQVGALSARTGVPVKTLMLMAHGHMLRSLTGVATVLSGVTDNGRLEVHGGQNMVGLFLNVVPTLVPGGGTWNGLAQRLRATEAASKAYRGYPLSSVLRRHPALAVDTNFTFNNFHVTQALLATDWLEVSLGDQFEEVSFNLSLRVSGNAEQGFDLALGSRLGLTEAFATRLYERFVDALRAMVDDFDAEMPMPLEPPLPLPGLDAVYSAVRLLRWEGALQQSALQDVAEQLLAEVVAKGTAAAPTWMDVPAVHVHDAGMAEGQQVLEAAARLAATSEAGFHVVHARTGGWQYLAVGAAPSLTAALPHAASALCVRYRSLSGDRSAWEAGTCGATRWVPALACQRSFSHWREALRQAPLPLALPSARTRRGQDAEAMESVCMAAHWTPAVGAWAGLHGVSAAAIWIAAWTALLSRLSGQCGIVLGVASADESGNPVASALRLDFADTPTADWMTQVSRGVEEALSHPLPSAGDLAQVWATPIDADAGQALPLGVAIGVPAQGHDLALALPAGDAAGVRLEFRSDVFETGTIRIWSRYLETLLSGLLSGQHASLTRIPLLSAEERQQVLREFNETDAPYPRDILIHALFERQVSVRGEALALEFDGQTLSYAMLNRRANQVAHYLIAAGVRPDERVGLCVERGFDMVIALLGILKAGGAYVPLDPGYPQDRLAHMLADSAPRLLLSHSSLAPLLPATPVPVVWLDDAHAWQAQPTHDPDPETLGLTARHLAYVIYTSGSTGMPKGAMNQHDGVVNRLLWAQSEFSLDEQDRVLQKTPFGFDVSVWEIFLPLLAGARLVLARPGGHQDPAYLAALIERARITMLHFVPSMLQAFTEQLAPARCASVRYLLCSGEALPAALQNRVLERLPDVALYNLYGPTEAAVDVTYWRCEKPSMSVPIGFPVANTRIYIVDGHLQPVPVGVAGELLIGGIQVGRGYLNRPELTAERFIDDPFDPAGGKLYRTGDLARWRADGAIDYLGRNDFQVKIRGFRIELGEIEAQLAACEGVREAVVLAREDVPGDKRLVAYLAPRDGAQVSIPDLRERLSRQLAEYMVPAAFVLLERLPLTPNGKLDRAALPAPERDALTARAYEPPLGEVEAALAGIWQELLGVERVGRHDHFFELGGHSLMVIVLNGRLQQAGYAIDAVTVFTTPVLSNLAAALSLRAQPSFVVPPNLIGRDAASITPSMLPLVALSQGNIDDIVASVPGGISNVQDIYPLVPLQQGMLFHHLLGGEGDVYLQRTLMTFDHRELVEQFLDALRHLIARHDILRTSFRWLGLPEPVQVVHRDAPLPVVEHALEGDVAAGLIAHTDPRKLRLDPRQAPLLAVHFAEHKASGKCSLALLNHHLISDHVTLALLIGEIGARLSGRTVQLPEPMPYRDFVARLKHIPAEHGERYFRAQLQDVDEPTLPFGLTDVRGTGAAVAEATVVLDRALSMRVRGACRLLGVTTAAFFHVAWALVVSRFSGRDDVVFGTVLSGRQQGGPGADQMLGMFINTLPIRARLGEVTAHEALMQTQEQLAQLLMHEQTSLAQAQRCSAVVAPLPLFSAVLNYRLSRAPDSASHRVFDGHGIEVAQGEERSNYPLLLNLNDFGIDFGIDVECVEPASPLLVAQTTMAAVERLVEALTEESRLPVRQLDIIPATARQQVLRDFNATDLPYARERLIHALFEEQVRVRGDAPALEFDGQTLSYAMLNRRANQVAHYLIAAGVRPDERVGLCVERGFDMVIALLGILKAGGAYVPLDPGYPQDRLAHMLADSAPRLLLSHSSLAPLLPATPVPVVWLDDAHAWQAQPTHDPDPATIGLTARHLAYVIYTSGSTGMPKGAMNQHDGVVNRLLWAQSQFSLDEQDRVLQKTPFGFDVSVWEIFLPLLAGARLVLARPGGHQDPAYLAALIERARITMLHFVPSMLQAFTEQLAPARCASVRYLLCSGEALPAALQNRVLERLPDVALYNLYGPTEAAVDVTYWRCEKPSMSVPIGFPVANTRIYIVDGHLQPVPVGVAGELFIGGIQVGRGYLNRPELTAERFIDDPFDPAGGKLYRTGDLARWRADGAIDYLGRNDFQVKIRGFRIELGEIEAQLAACEGVREAVVLAREDVPGDKRLVAYLAPRDGAQVSIPDLRERLSRQLAEYMVPAAFVLLERLPLTPNGKLDRAALPAPERDALTARAYEPPLGEVEAALAGIWQELLGVERVGRHDHFFELGGHSLSMMQVIVRVRETIGAELTPMDLFQSPLLADLADRILMAQLALLSPEELAVLGLDLGAEIPSVASEPVPG